MISKKKILLIVISLIIAGLLFYTIYIKKTFNNFSDLGARIQLQSSRPIGYINFYSVNQNVYDNTLASYGISTNAKVEEQMVYPIPYPLAYPVDYPVHYSNVKYHIEQLYEDDMGPPYPYIDRT
jgi:hypothetical protein